MAVSKVVSIEITDLYTRVCEMGYGKKNPVVYKSITFDNPIRSVDDGFIMEKGIYGTELTNQLASAGIKCKDVVFSLTSNKIVSREVTIPEMKAEMLQNLIENERTEYFPMDTSEHRLTFHVLEHLKETKEQRIIVFAVPEILIKNYEALAAERDLKIVALDYCGNSIYQWLRKKKQEPMDMYLQLNEKNTMFTIMDNNLLTLQRNMNFGTMVLINNLIEERYYGEEISVDEAMLKLQENTLIYPSYNSMLDVVPQDEDAAKLHELKGRLTDAVRPLITNVARVLEYYNTLNREAKVNKIYIGGAGAHIKGLKELIESEFNGVEVVMVEQLPDVNIHKKNTGMENRSSEYIACLGAAIPTINFYKAKEKESMAVTMIFCLVGLVAVIAASVVIILNCKSTYDNEVKKKDTLNAQLTELKNSGIEQLEQKYNSSLATAAEVVLMDASTFTFNEKWNEILGYLESESVSEIVVGSLSSDANGLSLNITVNSKEEAAKLLLQLQKIPYFGSVTINSIAESVDEETNIKTVSFSVICTYQLPVTENEEVAE